jgi:IS30 family transposase
VGQGSRLTVGEQARIVELAAIGLPSRLIGREVGRSHGAVWSCAVKSREAPPPERVRSRLRLSLVEREEISCGVAAGESLRGIARRLGRAPSMVSREVARNRGRRGDRACRADRDALSRVC